MSRHLLPIVIILLISILLSLPLTVPGLYQIHDDQQIARLYLFDQSAKSGQFPVRWVDQLGFGYGYPLFVFYPPFVYMLGEIYHLVGFSFVDSVKLVFFSSILLSGFAMYFVASQFWGRLAGITAAAFYLAVPYRAIDIYVRGALAESFTFVWLPLILWSFFKLTKTQKPIHIYLSGIFLAALMITHNLIFLPFMLLLPSYLLFLIWKSPDKKLSTVNCLLSTVLALGLSAFFWLPALLEKKYTIVDDLLLVNLANFRFHFVYPTQLWNWAWGFGGSAAGLADGISFKIGKLHVLFALAASILAIFHLIKNKRMTKFSTLNSQLSILFFLLFAFSAFMTTAYSSFIWDIIKPLAYLQFPWRFLTFTALFSSLAAGAAIYLLRLPPVKLFCTLILILLLVVSNLKLFRPQFYRWNFTDELATVRELITWDVSHSSFEYIPKGVPQVKSSLGTNLVDIQKDQIPKTKLAILKGEAHIVNQKNTPSQIEFTLQAESITTMQANIFNFPGWQVAINGQPTAIDDHNRLKLITFDVPSGFNLVKIDFKNTPVRQAANFTSFATLLLVLLLALRSIKIGI